MGEVAVSQTDDMCEHHIQRALWWRLRSSLCVLPNYTPSGWYESDMYAVTKAGFATEYEIKVSHADFKADFRKFGKHGRLAGDWVGKNCGPSRFFYVMPAEMVAVNDIPPYAGLIFCKWQLGQRRAYPLLTLMRKAPRLRKTAVSHRVVPAMRRTAVFRFWNERFRFENYKRDVKRVAEIARGGALAEARDR